MGRVRAFLLSRENDKRLHAVKKLRTSLILFILTLQPFSCKNIWQKVELTRGAGHFSKKPILPLWRAINHHRYGHLPKILYQVPQLDVIFRMMYHMDDFKTKMSTISRMPLSTYIIHQGEVSAQRDSRDGLYDV